LVLTCAAFLVLGFGIAVQSGAWKTVYERYLMGGMVASPFGPVPAVWHQK
jgi:hypothetical protein